MEHLEILNTRQIDRIHDKLEEQYGFTEKLDHAFLKSNKGKIYIVSPDIRDMEFEDFNINSVGMYFASEDSGGNLRLSIEGSQLVGPHATKNVYEISDAETQLWMAGQDLEADEEHSPFFIIKNGDDYITCGKIIDGRLKNYVPKSRRITSPI